MSDTALIVVDAQESFRHRPYWSDGDVSAFVNSLQSLIDGCSARRVPIFQVFHVEDEDAFSLASGWVRTGAGAVKLRVIEMSAGLPRAAADRVAARPATTVPVRSGDATLVARTFTF